MSAKLESDPHLLGLLFPSALGRTSLHLHFQGSIHEHKPKAVSLFSESQGCITGMQAMMWDILL